MLLRQFLGVSFEGDELAHELAVDVHNGGIIVEISAIVLGTENGDKLLVFSEEAITIFHDLVTTADQIEIMLPEELLQLRPTEDVATATFILLPVSYVFIRVIPEQISHQALVRNVRWLWYLFDLIEAAHMHRYTAMHAHNLLVNQRHERHVVERVVECLPQ